MESGDRKRLVGLGEVLWDLFPEGKQLGGAPTNFAWHAQARGADSEVVSCVGDDGLGREILERMDGWGLGREHIAVDMEHPTGTVDVWLDERGVPRYTIREDVAWDYIPWSAGLEALARSADAVCFGSLCQRAAMSRETIARFLEATRPDCLRVLDINLRPTGPGEDVILASLRRANVLKLNDAELPVLSAMLGLEGSDRDRLAGLADAFDLQLIALTRGEGGSLLQTATGVSDHDGYRVEVADTVGAGDAFTAAMVMSLLGGDGPETINEKANRAAAEVCGHAGAIPS